MMDSYTANAPMNRPPQVACSLSDSWEKRLDALNDVLFGAQDALDRLDNEHFGPTPEQASSGKGPAAVPNGRADRISALIDRAIDKAERLRSSANSLANRI